MQSGSRQGARADVFMNYLSMGVTTTPPWISVITERKRRTMFKYKALSILYNLCPSKKLKKYIWDYANAEYPIVKQ